MIRALAIACLLLLLSTITFGVMWHMRGLTIDTYQQAAKTNATTIATLGNANADQTKTIADLQARLKTAAGQQQAVEAKARAAQAAADLNAANRDKALATAQDLRRKLYATDPDAGHWAVGSIPASLSEQLRDEWSQAATGDP